jgi:hypothetical protein
MDFWHNPFWKGMGTVMKAVPNGVYKLGANAAKGMLLYAGGAALGGALGGAGAESTGAGEGGYQVLEGMPPLGDGAEGGAMDMYGSQSSPTDASTVFDEGGTPQSLGGRQQLIRQLMQNRMQGQGMSQPYRYRQPDRVQPNFVFPSPIVSVMPKDTYGSY